MSILTNLRNIFPFPFPHNLRCAPSQTVNVGAYVVCHISEGSTTNPLQDKKKGLGNLIKFFKTFNHTGLGKHLERQEQLHKNYRKIKLNKKCQQYVYNKNKKHPDTIALLPKVKATSKILRSSMETFD